MSELSIYKQLLEVLHEYVAKTNSASGKVLYEHLIDNSLKALTADKEALAVLSDICGNRGNAAYRVQLLLNARIPEKRFWSFKGKVYEKVHALLIYPNGYWSDRGGNRLNVSQGEVK